MRDAWIIALGDSPAVNYVTPIRREGDGCPPMGRTIPEAILSPPSHLCFEECNMHTRRFNLSALAETRYPLCQLLAHSWSILPVCVASLALASGVAAAGGSPYKADDGDFKAKVAELVKELDASKATVRQAAQEKLIQLGAD